MPSTFETEAALIAAFKAAGWALLAPGKRALVKNDRRVVHYDFMGGAWHWFYL